MQLVDRTDARAGSIAELLLMIDDLEEAENAPRRVRIKS